MGWICTYKLTGALSRDGFHLSTARDVNDLLACESAHGARHGTATFGPRCRIVGQHFPTGIGLIHLSVESTDRYDGDVLSVQCGVEPWGHGPSLGSRKGPFCLQGHYRKAHFSIFALNSFNQRYFAGSSLKLQGPRYNSDFFAPFLAPCCR